MLLHPRLGLRQASGRRRFSVLSAGFALAFCLVLGTALAGTPRPKELADSVTGSDYILALATANRFLHAWQTQDEETGILLLTDKAKRHTSEGNIAAFFSTAGCPAYEIARGKKIRNGRYVFPIALFDLAGNPQSRNRTGRLYLIVARTGKNDWAVDKLP